MRRPPRRHDGGSDMTRQHGTAPSQRQLRVGEEIRHALARILARGDLRDPELFDVAITVTEVRASPDLRHATAFVTPLGGADLERVVAALRRAAPFLQGRVGRELRLRFTPSLAFEADRSFDEAGKIDRLLREIDGDGDGDGR
jgi:ribosome-binding factor A